MYNLKFLKNAGKIFVNYNNLKKKERVFMTEINASKLVKLINIIWTSDLFIFFKKNLLEESC